MDRYNHFLFGFIPGLLLPIGFMWLYLSRLYPGYNSFFETLKLIYSTVLFGKILLLSSMPNMVFVYIFYKSDSFKIATGVLISGLIYFIASIFVL